MFVVIWIVPRHLGQQTLVVRALDLALREELPDRSGHRRRALRTPLVLADNHLLPLVEEGIRPDHLVDGVLGHGEQHMHHGEGEEDVRIGEDSPHKRGG